MSQRDLLELAHITCEAAGNAGATDIRAFASRNRETELEWRDGKLDRIRETTKQSLGLTLYVDGRYSSHSTSDVREEAVKPLVEELVGMTKYLAKDKHRVLPPKDRYEPAHEGSLNLFDENVLKVTPEGRVAKAKKMEESARAADKDGLIISVTSTVGDLDSESVCVTSNGQEIGEQGTRTWQYLEVSIKDTDDRKPIGMSYNLGRHVGELVDPATLGPEAYQRALDQRGMKQAATGDYEVVIENRVVSRLASQLLRPLQGSALQQKQSFFEGKIGEQVASKLLTITSDPHVVGAWASTNFDGEGMASKPMAILEKGVLKNYFLDTYYASKLGLDATTGGGYNYIWDTGKRSCEQLVKSIKKGIFVTSFLGGNSNSATGDFSAGIKGFFVKRGKIIHPVSEMNISGNHLETWKNLVEVGNDPWLNGSSRSPSLKFKKVSCSGVK